MGVLRVCVLEEEEEEEEEKRKKKGRGKTCKIKIHEIGTYKL